MKITLDDVAEKAGVSRATVDRVLNGRGNVKKSTAERVHRALFTVNYHTNFLPDVADRASSKFDFIFPVLPSNYFDAFLKEIENSALSFARLNTQVVGHMTDNLSAESLASKILEVGRDTDGVAFVALDHPIVREAVDQLAEKGVGTVSLVSDLSRSKRLAFVGLDNRAAGRTAGMLMGRYLSKHQSGKIALFPGRLSYRGHEEREAGFRSVIQENFDRFDVLILPTPQYSNENSSSQTRKLLLETPDLVGIYNTGGATQGIADVIRYEGKQEEVVFIAHELTNVTRGYLFDRAIDVLINQDIRTEIFNAVELLLRHKRKEALHVHGPQPRVEIYLSENVY
ncbi:MAG: LacI family DNA-binding transcriptional regulator [Hyphomonadaceae bacterium]|nr:LacI family DNA-binding transcriptional regulator [Hyphomonadaceae bacterium]